VRTFHSFAGASLTLLAVSCGGDSARSDDGTIVISRVIAPAPANFSDSAHGTMAVYATIANRGDVADTLASTETPVAGASMHVTVDHASVQMMMPIPSFALPAKSFVRFAPGSRHIMLEGLTRPFAPGDTVPLTFVFRHAGRVGVTARVVAYEQLEKALAP